jgi:hypothetical protein
VPTYDSTERFLRDYLALTLERRVLFNRAVKKFVADLRTGRFRKGLRIKSFQGLDGAFEMTWAPDGRALFRYGEPHHPGDKHVI